MAQKYKELTLDERIVMMEKFKNGTPAEKSEASSMLLESLDSYIYYMIHKHFAGYIGMIEDLAQSGRLAILEHAKDYNPKFKMTTFFSFHIQNALQDVVNRENGESHYYAESKNIIIKTIRALGMSPDNIDEQSLALHLNMTTGRLHSILEKTIRKKKIELIEEDGDTAVEGYGNPEDQFLQDEFRLRVRQCISQLDEQEQIVLCMHFGFYYPKWNDLENTHKLTEIQKAFDSHGIPANAVNLYRSARRHIADILYKEGMVSKRNRYISAKESDVGLKFKDVEEAQEMFDALNESEDLF